MTQHNKKLKEIRVSRVEGRRRMVMRRKRRKQGKENQDGKKEKKDVANKSN